MAIARPLLPNAPLAEVVCELRFHGELGLFAAWGEIHRALRSRFPQLYVPGAVVGTSPFLQHIKLADTQGTRGLLLSINSVAYTCSRQYPGWIDFKNELSDIHATFFRHVPDVRFSRFGLRCVNILPPFGMFGMQTSSPGVIHPALRLSVGGLKALEAGFREQPSVVMTLNAPDNLALRLHVFQGVWQASGGTAGPPIADAGQGTILDFDAFKTEGLRSEGIGQFLDQAHAVIEDAFLGVVTPDYQKFMEGGQQ